MLGMLDRVFGMRGNGVTLGEGRNWGCEQPPTARAPILKAVEDILATEPRLTPPTQQKSNHDATILPPWVLRPQDSGVYMNEDEDEDEDFHSKGRDVLGSLFGQAHLELATQESYYTGDTNDEGHLKRRSQGSEALWEGVMDLTNLPDVEQACLFAGVDGDDEEVEMMLPLREELMDAGHPDTISHATSGIHSIAHSSQHVKMFDLLNIPWSVQWQIGVLISSGTLRWSDISVQKLNQLRGSNSDAGPKVSSVLLDRLPPHPSPPSIHSPWSELDIEEAATEAERVGLSGNGESSKMGTWWGGRVEQMAVMYKVPPPQSLSASRPRPTYKVRLQQLKVEGKSCRFRRRFGSRRFIRLQLPDIPRGGKELESFKNFLCQPFLLHGRVYRAFYGELGVAHLFETDENHERSPVQAMGDTSRVSFETFAEWHNPIELNGHQTITKYCARWKLGLSTSIPVLLFDPDSIMTMPDLGDYSDMTDGCGRINKAAMRVIQQHRHLEAMPTAVQGRLAGAKGLWLLDVFDVCPTPRIWCTDSQVKIKYPPESLAADPSLRTFDFLRVNQTKIPSSLTAQPINNLAHNNVPPEVFIKILQSVVETELNSLLEQWEGERHLQLWGSIFMKGGVAQLRKRRRQAVFVRKFSRVDEKESAADEVSEQTVLQVDRGLYTPDPTSGYPDNVYERAVELLQAGFEPQHCPVLTDAVKTVIRKERDRILNELKLPLQYSAEAWAVPDFLGILAPGEIYFSSSEPLDYPGGVKRHVLEGPVVVWRSPNRVPSDTQKLVAVDRHELRDWKNVVVFSTKGDRSAMSLLSGGDFDGDIVAFTWHRDIVYSFQNASPEYADPPLGFEEDIDSRKDTVHDYIKNLNQHPLEERRVHLQHQYLLACCQDFYVGILSNIAGQKARIHGYDSKEAIRFAYLFAYALDAVKSGKHPKPGAHRSENIETLRNKPRSTHLPPFIMDTLREAANQMLFVFNQQIKELKVDYRPDKVLPLPWERAIGQAQRLQRQGYNGRMEELNRIASFVGDIRASWKSDFTLGKYKSPGTEEVSSRKFKERRANLEAISRAFNDGLDSSSFQNFSPLELRCLKASYAYTLETQERNGRQTDFSFHLAFSDLCLIKSTEAGQLSRYKSIVPEFLESLSLPKKFLQELNEQDAMSISD